MSTDSAIALFWYRQSNKFPINKILHSFSMKNRNIKEAIEGLQMEWSPLAYNARYDKSTDLNLGM